VWKSQIENSLVAYYTEAGMVTKDESDARWKVSGRKMLKLSRKCTKLLNGSM